MDIKAKIDELVDKIKNDKSIGENFKNDPVATVEGLIGVNLPKEQIEQLVQGIKTKINIDSVSGAIGGLFGKK